MSHDPSLLYTNINDKAHQTCQRGLRALLLASVALAICAPAENARADDECGRPTSSNQTISCDHNFYTNGITYENVNGLTLDLSNSDMLVNQGLSLTADPTSTNAVTLNATQFTEINGDVTVTGTSDVEANIKGGQIDGRLHLSSEGGKITVNFENAVVNDETYIHNTFGSSPVSEKQGDVTVTTKGNTKLKTLGFNTVTGSTYVTISGGTIRQIDLLAAAGDGSTASVKINEESGRTEINQVQISNFEKKRANIDFDITSGIISFRETQGGIAPAAVILHTPFSDNSSTITANISGGTIESVFENIEFGTSAISMSGRGNLIFNMSSGNIISTGTEAVGIAATFWDTSSGLDLTISGRDIAVKSTDISPLDSRTSTSAILVSSGGNHEINMTGGTILTKNANGIAFLNPLSGSTQKLNLSAGILAVDYEYGKAISFTNAEPSVSDGSLSAEISIGNQMIVDASEAAYSIYNGIDLAASQIAVGTSGHISGDVMLGGGSSNFRLFGGSVWGNIYGDYDQHQGSPSDTQNQGGDQFTWTGGEFIGTFFGQGGNDAVSIELNNASDLFLRTAVFDGGAGGMDTISFLAADAQSGQSYWLDVDSVRNFETITLRNAQLKIESDGSTVLSTEGEYGEIIFDNYATLSVNVDDNYETLSSSIDSNIALLRNSILSLINSGTKSQELVINGNVTANYGYISTTTGNSTINIGNSVKIYGDLSGSVIFQFFLAAGNPNMTDRMTIYGTPSGNSLLLPIVFSAGELRPYKYGIVFVNSPNEVDPSAFTSSSPTTVGAFQYVAKYFPDGYFQMLGGIAQKFGPSFALVPEVEGESTAFERPEFAETATIHELIDAGIVLQPYVPLYEAYQSVLLEMTRLPSMKTRSGGRYDDGEAFTSGPALDAMWGRIGGGFDHFDPQSSTASYDYDLSTFEMQAGLDGLFLDNANGALVGGVTAHYRTGEAKIASRYGDSKIRPDGYGFGGTLTWFGENGFYTDAQAALTWYSSELKADDLPLSPKGSDGFGYALSIEAGQAFAVGTGLALTPQAQLSFADVSIDGFTGAYSDDVSFSDGQSLLARAGLALEKESTWQDVNGQARAANVYGIANLYYEFLGETKARVVNLYDFTTDPDDFSGEIGLGGSIDWQAGKLQYSAFAELTASTGFDTGSYGYGGNLGLKVRW